MTSHHIALLALIIAAWTPLRALAQADVPGPVGVALGSDFGCGLGSDGHVRCWGRNDAGQCGSEGETSYASPRRVLGVDHVRAIAVGHSHVCALRRDGEVWCWGDNRHGQLGVEGLEERARPAPVQGLSHIDEIALGASFSCARREDGAVFCWGNGRSGIFGLGRADRDRSAPARLPLPDASRIWAGRRHACARDSRGRVRCWGANERQQAGAARRIVVAPPTLVRGIEADSELALADTFSCGLSERGEIRCWGRDILRVNGDSGDDNLRPVRDRRLWLVHSLSATHRDVCAVADELVYCWGSNERQHLHVPADPIEGESAPSPALPTPLVGFEAATEVVTGHHAQCLRYRDGSWWCWGWNGGPGVGAVGVDSGELQVGRPTRLPW